ncbi:hypothetical protein [Thermococcus sp. GR6]|uniref:hypothetical protein n=1 Tax=Thermococcus sp. GR6 TaxID=1638256 RepID=UPI0014314858|nr:hypothetical protein [Thermococcus sp. GR6]NJE43258.1 hypothetical protein [Thermococcus sp. GR6]
MSMLRKAIVLMLLLIPIPNAFALNLFDLVHLDEPVYWVDITCHNCTLDEVLSLNGDEIVIFKPYDNETLVRITARGDSVFRSFEEKQYDVGVFNLSSYDWEYIKTSFLEKYEEAGFNVSARYKRIHMFIGDDMVYTWLPTKWCYYYCGYCWETYEAKRW